MAAESDDDPIPQGCKAGAESFYVVGIGASAGGLAALQVLLGSLPARPGFACVIVMHLSPEHDSHLAGLLQQYTSMPVEQVTSTVVLEPNRVFVIPPKANLESIDTHLRLTEMEQRRVERAPIDHFLRSLAVTHDGTAVGVVLTGGGSDGSIGLRHIKERCGLTIAQDPLEAEFDSMPRSAIARGTVDLVLPLKRIGSAILQFCSTGTQLPTLEEMEAHDRVWLDQILGVLRQRTQRDFEVYQRATLLRRLRRRMKLSQITMLAEYFQFLTQQDGESEAVANDLHLAPTEFFADEPLFAELQKRILPDILERKTQPNSRVRIWSFGCATGEEAYSLAMLLAESSPGQLETVQRQVFASDASETFLNIARLGLYPREIATSVSPERLRRFFTSESGLFRVKRDLRDQVLFACHDLFKDPPFAHLDLIVCRTLLAELEPQIRQEVLSLLHYSLEPDGLLLVGPRDEVKLTGFVAVETQSLRAFRKAGVSPRAPHLRPHLQSFGPGGIRGTAPRGTTAPALQSEALREYRAALETHAPPSVLINAANEVVYFSANAAQYIHIPGGELTHELTRLVEEPLRTRLLEALERIGKGAESWDSEPAQVRTEHGTRRVILRLQRLETRSILVVMDDREPQSRPEKSSDETADEPDESSQDNRAASPRRPQTTAS